MFSFILELNILYFILCFTTIISVEKLNTNGSSLFVHPIKILGRLTVDPIVLRYEKIHRRFVCNIFLNNIHCSIYKKLCIDCLIINSIKIKKYMNNSKIHVSYININVKILRKHHYIIIDAFSLNTNCVSQLSNCRGVLLNA